MQFNTSIRIEESEVKAIVIEHLRSLHPDLVVKIEDLKTMAGGPEGTFDGFMIEVAQSSDGSKKGKTRVAGAKRPKKDKEAPARPPGAGENLSSLPDDQKS